MYKEVFGPGYGAKILNKAKHEIPASKMRRLDKEIDAQIKSVENLKMDQHEV